MPSLTTDFIGRVQRLPLRPTPANSLMPLFEAVSNALHAIEDRYPTTAAFDGEVTIEVLREETQGEDVPGAVLGFRVTDNGIGLDADNYASFLKPDSRHKEGRGGKGVGRLGWLKVFEGIRVDSTFADGEALGSISFDFRLTEKDQVLEHQGREGPPATPGTIVTLQGFRTVFSGKCPAGADTLMRKLAAHFLPVLVSDESIPIAVVDGATRIPLADFWNGEVRSSAADEVRVLLEGEERVFQVRHLRVSKAMRPDKGHHRLFLCGDSRTVDEHGLDGSLGLRALNDGEVYVGCVSSPWLDSLVNAERTGFTLPEDELAEVRRRMLPSVSTFLAEYLREQNEAKRRTTQGLVLEYPQFLFINEDMDGFVEDLKPGSTSQEEVFVEMARARFRRQRNVKRLEHGFTTGSQEELRARMDAYSRLVTTDQKGVLAEYVIRRKAVLDVLDRMRGYEDAQAEIQHREDALHALVCPMRRDSTQITYEDHNLWLLDDRLAFFAYFNSDKRLDSYTDSPSADRPDIAFFYDTVSAWLGEGDASNTAVLVEFKRPNRDDYTGNDNPVRQVGNYVELLRTSSRLRDHLGRHRTVRLRDAAYHCYIVADLTPSLLREIRDYQLRPTPDGMGWFGYLGGAGKEFWVEIIPYEKLLRDAKLRNAIFFQKVGLTDLDPRLGIEDSSNADSGDNDGQAEGGEEAA